MAQKPLRKAIMHQHPLHSHVVDESWRPTQDLLQLLSLLDLQHDGSLKNAVEVTQHKFFQRKEDGRAKERWQLEEIVPAIRDDVMRESGEALAANFRAKCLDLFMRLKMLERVFPCRTGYDYGLLLGALVTRVRGRLADLCELWSNGCSDQGVAHVPFDTIVFLSGERPLQPDTESMAVLLDENNGILPFREGWAFSGEEPKTELEMMRLVWDQAQIPKEMRDLPVTWVNAKMKPNPDGSGFLRPSTGDTVCAWLATNPTPGCCLAVSNQPHVGYQDAVLLTHLPRGFTVETVGAAASLDHKLAFYLRELAGWLRQLLILQSVKQ